MPNYVPGGSEPLVKAQLAACEAPNTQIDVYFNPKEITIDKPVPWQKSDSNRGGSIVKQPAVAKPGDPVPRFHIENAWPTKWGAAARPSAPPKSDKPIPWIQIGPAPVQAGAVRKAPPAAPKAVPQVRQLGGRSRR